MAWKNKTTWDATCEDLLRKLWCDGLTASQIANRIPGFTRNAIVGKANRMGLPGRAPRGNQSSRRNRGRTKLRTPQAQRQAPKRKVNPTVPVEPFTPRAEPYIALELRKSLLDLEQNDCRWPIGDGPYAFCARKRHPGSSYCQDHHAIAYDSVRTSEANRRVKSQPAHVVSSRRLEKVH